MARSLPTSVITAVNKQTTTSVFLVLLEIYHPDIGTYYLVNNTQNVVAGATTYLAFPFSVMLPPDDQSSKCERGSRSRTSRPSLRSCAR